jgi:hypothetical protein
MAEAAVKHKVDRLEEALMEMAYQSRKTDMSLERLSQEMRDFKDEMGTFKDEMRAFKDEMNRRWGQLANRLGTLVEDIVAPGVPSAVERAFGFEVEDLIIRRRKKKEGRVREYDAIAITPAHVFVIDVKANYKVGHMEDFQTALDDFFWYFPEIKGQKQIGVIASLYLTEDIINLATKKGYLALNLSGDHLRFVNAENISL